MTLAVASSGAVAAGTTSLSVPYPSGIVAGDLLVLAVGNKYPSNGPSTPSGWTLQGQGSGGSGTDTSTDQGHTYATIFTKEATGSESGSLSVTLTSATTSGGRMWRVTRQTANAWNFENTTGADNTSGDDVSITGAGSITVQAGDILFFLWAVNTDARAVGGKVLALSGATIPSLTNSYDTFGSSVFGALEVSYGLCTSGTGTAAPTFNALEDFGSDANAPTGGASFLRIRADPPPPIAFGTAGAVAVGTTSLSVAYPSSPAAGDMLVLAVANKYPTNGPSTPSGWTLVSNAQGSGGVGAAGADSGTVYSTVFYKIATGSESGSETVTLTSANSSQGQIIRYTVASGYQFDTPVAHNGADNTAGTAFSVTAGADPGLTVDDLLVVVAATNTDARTYSAEAVTATGISAWGTVTERTDAGTTQGDDCRLVISEHPVATGTSSAAPVYTMTASGTASNQNAGSAVFFRLRASLTGGGGDIFDPFGMFGFFGF